MRKWKSEAKFAEEQKGQWPKEERINRNTNGLSKLYLAIKLSIFQQSDKPLLAFHSR